MNRKYRPDIDGLRAIAVLSVVFFHTGVELLSGGFVGVDIFFVISGYLITSIIIREIEANKFSVAKFYERRFRRILPVLTFVTITSLVVGAFLLRADDFKDLGKTALATTIFSSNIVFWQQSGYFDGPSALKPLLHTWSLAVEEQFYIFFPLLLMLIANRGSKKYLRWLILLVIISFIICQQSMKLDPSAAFFLFPTRAWELLIGSLLALNFLPTLTDNRLRHLLSIIGFLMMMLSIFLIDEKTAFPGVSAAIPTLGAALYIYSGTGGKGLANRILSIRPFVFVGLISYSLYMWHWPIIVYTKLFMIRELTVIEIGIMLSSTFIISIFSWRFIEQTFRNNSLLKNRKMVFTSSSVISVIILSAGLLIIVTKGFPERYDFISLKDATNTDHEWKKWGKCQNVTKKIQNNQELCIIGKNDKQPSFIFWGDSHAKALAPSVNLSAINHDLSGRIATLAACPPLLSIERANSLECDKFNKMVLQYIVDNPELITVILAARWTLAANGKRYKNEEGAPVKLIDLQSSNSSGMTNKVLFGIGLRRTINALQKINRQVILVSQIPEIGYDVPSVMFIAKSTNRNVESIISPTVNDYLIRNETVISTFSALKAKRDIILVDPYKLLCRKASCKVFSDNILLYRDNNHLSTYGAKYVSSAFDNVFKDIAEGAFSENSL